jgi:hypothetical protein
MPNVEIRVSPKGEVQIEGKGFVGPACQDAMRALKAAIEVKSEQKKPEFNQLAGVQQGS